MIPTLLGWLAISAMLLLPALCMPPFQTCTLFSDDFAVDDLASAYHTSAGSWAISGGVLTCTSASALLRCETAATADLTADYVSASITCATTSDIGRLIVGYTDDSNYWFCEVQPGATNGTLKLFQRSGGVNTQKGSNHSVAGFTTSQTAAVCLSYVAGQVASAVTIGASPKASITYDASISIPTTKVGMGTGAGSSSVTFDSFLFSKHNYDVKDCSNCVACGGCTTSIVPGRIQVVVVGVASKVGACPDAPHGDSTGCTNFNATFICTPTNCNCAQLAHTSIPPEPDCPENTNVCRWIYVGDIAGNVCSTDTVHKTCVVFAASSSGAGSSTVDIYYDGQPSVNNQAGEIRGPAGTPACNDLNSFSLSSGFTSLVCNFSGASATATAL